MYVTQIVIHSFISRIELMYDLQYTHALQYHTFRFNMLSRDFSTQTPSYFCFSAATCLELLDKRTDDQLIREYYHFKLLGCKIEDVRSTRSGNSKFNSASINTNRDLSKLLSSQSNNDLTDTLGNLDAITKSISYLANTTEQAVEAVSHSGDETARIR